MCNIFSLIFIKILKINIAIYILFDILILRDRKNIALTIYRTRYTLSGWSLYFDSLAIFFFFFVFFFPASQSRKL